MGFPEKKLEQIPVSTAKAKLLELVRDVQRGHGFEITKGGETVARLLPPEHHQALPATGFANVTITGDILSPLPADWTGDNPNLSKAE
ncbi:MAG: type II toxin-antitoxin system prevent-host-death family antitoxin [Deltaproteobacteria bacterium]|nr:type II toxin-antitoxin system prevent-host-death family antitoxin [Deltaproteobacteria bacterium]